MTAEEDKIFFDITDELSESLFKLACVIIYNKKDYK